MSPSAASASSAVEASFRSHRASPRSWPSRSAVYCWPQPSSTRPAIAVTAIAGADRRTWVLRPVPDMSDLPTAAEAENDVADPSQQGTDADPDEQQGERAPGVPDRPQPDQHLADPRCQSQAPQRDLVAEGD